MIVNAVAQVYAVTVLLTSREAADRLGVKVETLYAYVSRGVLRRHRDLASRSSRFDSNEVEALARRGRPRRSTRAPALDLQIRTSLTRITDGAVSFRDRDATVLATTCAFEQVAELLWTGTLPDRAPAWRAPDLAPLPPVDHLSDRLRVAVAMAAAADPLRGDLHPDAVVATARGLVAALVDAVAADAGAVPRLTIRDAPRRPVHVSGSVAGRLWSGLRAAGPVPPAELTTTVTGALVTTLNAALVLLADHELAASTLAARVAASTRADPYAVVLAGLGAMAGPLHGGASRAARRMLDDAASVGPARAVANALEVHGRYPGFGHRVYVGQDPRATVLLDLLGRSGADRRQLALVDDVVELVRRHRSVEPNVDLALAALGAVAGFPDDAGEVVFTVARTAGWVAHALEEYGEAPARFRPRAVYAVAT